MTDTANHLVPEQGKFRRALAAVFAWLEAMDYTSFDYTLDRIERLEREVGQLKEELRQSREFGRSGVPRQPRRQNGLIVLPQKSSRRCRLAIANAGSRLPVGRWFKSAGEAVTRKTPSRRPCL